MIGFRLGIYKREDQINTFLLLLLLKIIYKNGFDDVVAVIAFVILMNWYDSLFGVEAFQANPLPHQDPFGWLNDKYDRKPMQHTSYKSSRFELQMAGVNDNMCPGLAMADENGFVMSYQEAHNLVAETYPGYLEVNESCKITYISCEWNGY